MDNNKTHGVRERANVDQWTRSIIPFLLILLITLPNVNQVRCVQSLISHRWLMDRKQPRQSILPLMQVPQRVVRLRVSHDGHRHRHLVLHMTVGRPLIAHVRVRDTTVDFLIHILVSDLWLLMRLQPAKVALLVHAASDFFRGFFFNHSTLAVDFCSSSGFPRLSTSKVHDKLNDSQRTDQHFFLPPRQLPFRLERRRGNFFFHFFPNAILAIV